MVTGHFSFDFGGGMNLSLFKLISTRGTRLSPSIQSVQVQNELAC